MARPPAFAEYAASMPTAYHEAFDVEAIELHAGVVSRRESGSTRVEIWKELPERVVAICIVADDRPGLLSQISAALVAHEIDVVTAHAYVRTRTDGAKEALDFLWIRRVAAASGSIAPIRARDVAAFGEMIDALLRGKTTFDGMPPSSADRPISKSPQSSTRVRFDDGAGDGTMVLTVEATDRPGLLLLVTKAIFRANLQIIGLRATSEQGTAIDRFHLAELDGKPLVQARLLELQVEIFTAIETGGDDGELRAS
jgi:[protein-PII] uridylyltransferase